MRLRLNKQQKELLAPGLVELGNISLAALLFGTALSEHPKWIIGVAGVALYVVIIFAALYLKKGES